MLRKHFLCNFCLALIKKVVQILLENVSHLFKQCKVVVVLGFYLIGCLGGDFSLVCFGFFKLLLD